MFLQTLRKGAFPLAAQAKVLPPPPPPRVHDNRTTARFRRDAMS